MEGAQLIALQPNCRKYIQYYYKEILVKITSGNKLEFLIQCKEYFFCNNRCVSTITIV